MGRLVGFLNPPSGPLASRSFRIQPRRVNTNFAFTGPIPADSARYGQKALADIANMDELWSRGAELPAYC